jgi:hypothetical protein
VNYHPEELFGTPADMTYYERVERIYQSDKTSKLNTWELKFIEDLYWNPYEKYSDKQKAVINRIKEKLKID